MFKKALILLTVVACLGILPWVMGCEEPNEMTDILGPKPPTKKLELTDFGERIALRAGRLLVVNDEAHHTHDEENEWNKVVRRLHGRSWRARSRRRSCRSSGTWAPVRP